MKINISASKFEILCRELAEKLKEKRAQSIYGIPKNGLIVALKIKEHVPQIRVIKERKDILEDTWIVDDLIDSGKTLDSINKENPRAVLIVKNLTQNEQNVDLFIEAHLKSDWIDFYFEKEDDRADLIHRMIQSFGEDSTREGLLETPKRSSKAWDKILEGYTKNPKNLITAFENESSDIDQIVGLSNIEFYSTCEHHLLPFSGVAHIYYIPNEKIVGISKLARVLDCFARRLQNQERITKQIADFFEKELKAKGVAVILEAKHFCMMARGVEKQIPTMKTSDIRGIFREDEKARIELFQLIK